MEPLFLEAGLERDQGKCKCVLLGGPAENGAGGSHIS